MRSGATIDNALRADARQSSLPAATNSLATPAEARMDVEYMQHLGYVDVFYVSDAAREASGGKRYETLTPSQWICAQWRLGEKGLTFEELYPETSRIGSLVCLALVAIVFAAIAYWVGWGRWA